VLLEGGAEAPWDSFAPSFLEDLLNSVSHDDLPLSRTDVNAVIGPKTRELADALDRTWVPMKIDPEPRIMDLPTYQAIESPALRWIVRRSTRWTPGDIYVGINDVVQRQAQSGQSGQDD
jgi:hypothetical protein